MIYLQGQKDQAAVQDNERKKQSAELSARYRLLESKCKELEEKQFAGLDRTQMEVRLGELSALYEEAAKGSNSTAEIDAQILDLGQQQARRRTEQYQSKYTQAIAEANAKVQELGKQYHRENQILKAFVPGVSCPTCRRPVTEQNLAEVQGALQASINGILTAGREQRTQLEQLQQLDTKAQVVFDQFQSDDIIKIQDEIDTLTRQRDGETEGGNLNSLWAAVEHQAISLKYGSLSQEEFDRSLACQKELRQCSAELEALEKHPIPEQSDFDAQISQAQKEIKDLKILISNVILYARKRAELTFEALKMNRVEISLYDVVKSTGEQKAAFKFTYNGRRYDRLSLSEKIRAGMEVSELVKRPTGRNYPVFVDNMESVDDLANVRPTGQVIMAKCVRGAPLEVRPLHPIPVAGQKAA